MTPAAARIMGIGPITWAVPSVQALPARQARIRSTTVPCRPAEPSSVAQRTSSAAERSSASRIIWADERAPHRAVTWFPASLKARATGSNSATPTPPATHRTFPTFSMLAGCPSGPKRSANRSPTSSRTVARLVFPTAWTTRVMLPVASSPSTIVSGMRSLASVGRMMTN